PRPGSTTGSSPAPSWSPPASPPTRTGRCSASTSATARTRCSGPRSSECLIYTAYTGLRWGGLAGSRVGRADLDRRTIAVVEQLNELSGRMEWGPPKTAAGRRSVSLPPRLAEMLAKQLERPMVARSGLVFPTPLGEPMRRSNFARRVWAPAVEKLGLDGLRFHDLRHTAVALAISKGAHPKALQERMG